MRASPLLVPVGLLALSACSGEKSPPDREQNSALESPSLPASAGPSPAAQSQPMKELRADVSDLTGRISGLNTRMTDMGLVIDLPADALFDYDKASLTQAAEAELRKAAEVIRQSPPGAIGIIGHTDDHGSDRYNKTLSEERANSVAQWFRQQVGVRQREFEVSGLGESKPVAPNRNAQGADDPQGRARNRRVEVVIPTASRAGP